MRLNQNNNGQNTCGNASGQPFRVLHPDGYIDVSRAPVFYYHIKDHLGNVRAVIQASPGSTSGTLVQATDYYPFGMAYTIDFSIHRHENQLKMLRIDGRAVEDDSPTLTRNNPYLYNGKEEQPMPGKWLDYGARFHDAQIARFHTVDPLAEKYHPISTYAYVSNNPIKYVDPDGREIWLYQYDDEGKRIAELQYTPGMEYDGDNAYFASSIATLNQMNSVEIGGIVLGVLHGSENVFGVTNQTASIEGAHQFLENSDGGGTMRMGGGFTLESIAHEMFHGYQHEKGQGGASIFNEVEANLFGYSVAFQYAYDNVLPFGSATPMGRNNASGTTFQNAFYNLHQNNTFSREYFDTAVQTFQSGSVKNATGSYTNYPLQRSNQGVALISSFFPLMR